MSLVKFECKIIPQKYMGRAFATHGAVELELIFDSIEAARSFGDLNSDKILHGGRIYLIENDTK